MNFNQTLKQCLTVGMLIFSSYAVAADYHEFVQMPDRFNDALSFDTQGNLYASNSGKFGREGLSGSLVHKIDKNGEISIQASGLSGPLGHDFDSQGNMYIANYNNGEITKISVNGAKSSFSKRAKAGAVSGIVLNSKDEIFVSSFASGAIFKFDVRGGSEIWLQDQRLSGPVGIVSDENDNIYVGNYNNGRIFKITKNKELTELATSPDHSGYITYAKGMVYTTGINKHKIYQIPIDGSPASELPGSSSSGFKFPNGISANHDGSKLYVSNYLNNKIIVIENFANSPPNTNQR